MPPKPAQKAAAQPNSDGGGGGGGQLDLASLTTQQLMQVKKQLDDELEHLNNSFNHLRGAQTRFGENIKTIDTGVRRVEKDSNILVPLTTSLYVPGTMADRENVIIDIGTGFYVEKTLADATKFYEEKTKELAKSLKELENILQGKANNLRLVEEVYRQKMLQQQQQGGQQQGGQQAAVGQ